MLILVLLVLGLLELTDCLPSVLWWSWFCNLPLLHCTSKKILSVVVGGRLNCWHLSSIFCCCIVPWYQHQFGTAFSWTKSMATCSQHSQRGCTSHSNSLPHWKRYFENAVAFLSHSFCMCRYDPDIYAVDKIFNSETWVVLILLWCCRCKHSWLHFEHCHVGKSNTGPMQPVRRSVADQVSFPDLCSPRRCF
jgi:hypothetical protein